jgi:Uma2 family endonuclease
VTPLRGEHAKPITADEFFAMNLEGRAELVDGKIVRTSQAGAWHGSIAAELVRQVANHVREYRLGRVISADTGFILRRAPDAVRAPDVSFVACDRLPHEPFTSFFPGSPDLAVEVVSPSDSWHHIDCKLREYLDAGCGEVWIVEPGDRYVHVFSANARHHFVTNDQVLTSDVLPGFSLRVGELFEGWSAPRDGE